MNITIPDQKFTVELSIKNAQDETVSAFDLDELSLPIKVTGEGAGISMSMDVEAMYRRLGQMLVDCGTEILSTTPEEAEKWIAEAVAKGGTS